MVPGFLQVVLEWWVCELTTFLVASLKHSGGELVAASGILANLQGIFLMIWIGVSVASSVLVGRFIGAGSVAAARRAAKALGAVGFTAGLVVATGTCLSRWLLPPVSPGGRPLPAPPFHFGLDRTIVPAPRTLSTNL